MWNYIPTINDGVDGIVLVDQPGHLWPGGNYYSLVCFLVWIPAAKLDAGMRYTP